MSSHLFIYLFMLEFHKINFIVLASAIKQDVDEPSVKKPKADEVDSALESKIEKQNKKYYILRDELANQTKKPIHIAILEANQQAIPEGNSEVGYHTKFQTN